MSAAEVAERFCAEIGDGYRFAVVNFANPDMVGHTGVIPAVVGRSRRPTAASAASSRPCERARRRLPRHGRPRQRRADARARRLSPLTAHTTNPVPLSSPARRKLREGGELADLAPTAIRLTRNLSNSRYR